MAEIKNFIRWVVLYRSFLWQGPPPRKTQDSYSTLVPEGKIAKLNIVLYSMYSLVRRIRSRTFCICVVHPSSMVLFRYCGLVSYQYEYAYCKTTTVLQSTGSLCLTQSTRRLVTSFFLHPNLQSLSGSISLMSCGSLYWHSIVFWLHVFFCCFSYAYPNVEYGKLFGNFNGC